MLLGQSFHKNVAIQACNDYVAWACWKASADDQVVTIENAGSSHAVAADRNHVGVGGVQVQQGVQGQMLFHVIQRRAGKARRNTRVVEGEVHAAGLQQPDDHGIAHTRALSQKLYINTVFGFLGTLQATLAAGRLGVSKLFTYEK